jgi:adenylate cyclase
VIARNSTFIYKGKAVSVKQVAEELGVRYVLEGSVQRSGDRVRVTAQLIDALTGHLMWSEDYDREFEDIFELQDDISQQVVTELEVKLTEGETRRIWRRSTNNVDAYQYFQQGVQLHRQFSKLEMEQSAELLEKALALDPNFSAARVILGWSYYLRARNGYIEDLEGNLTHVIDLTEQVLAVDDANSGAMALLAEIYRYQEKYEQALALMEQAVALDPNDSRNIALLSSSLIYGGRAEEGLALIQKAMRLSPYYPAWYLEFLGRAHYVLENYDEAIAALEGYHELAPGDPDGMAELAYTYTAADRLDDARTMVGKLRKEAPQYRYPIEIISDPPTRDQIVENLRKAGLTE